MGEKTKKICISIIRKKYSWTILFFVIFVGLLDTNSIWRRYQLYQENEALRAEIRHYEIQYAEDTKQYEELQNNQDALERVARVNLLMKTENEDVYVIE